MELLKNNVLLTGSSGFLGKNISQALEAQRMSKLIKLDKHHLRSDTLSLDLSESNPLAFLNVDTKISATIHLAAQSCVYVPEAEKESIIKHNLACFENAVKITAKLGGKLLIHTSSSAVYGSINESSYKEDFECKPLGAYGESKLACETASLQLEEDYGVKIVNFRLHNLIGNYQKASMLPHLIYENILNNAPLELFGILSRSWTPVELLTKFFISLCNEAENPKAVQNLKNVYNYGSKTSVTQIDLISLAQEITGGCCNYKLIDKRPFEMQSTLPNMKLFEDTFGSEYVPQDSSFLEQSMIRVLETFKKY